MCQHALCSQPTINAQIAPPWSRGARAICAPSYEVEAWSPGEERAGGRGTSSWSLQGGCPQALPRPSEAERLKVRSAELG